MSISINNYDYECTKRCHLVRHGNAITAALTKKAISDELLAAFIAKYCRNFSEILDEQGRSALHVAASVGRYAVAEWLINHGASVALKDRESGHTALHRAMYYGCVGVAVLLLKYGAIIDVLDEDFVNPLQLCSTIPRRRNNGIGCEIMVWGRNKNYNLGIGNIEGKETPDSIDFFRKKRITIDKMSINAYHSVFITSNGEVYTTGHGKGGRLGNGNQNTIVYPTKTTFQVRSGQERIVDVSTGTYHTLLLSNENCIYSCGENNHCQLGIKPPPEKQLNFREIGGLHNFADKKINRIIAKDFHSIAVCDADVYVWGLNGGQFGMKKDQSSVILPKTLPLSTESSGENPVAANRDTTIKLIESSNAAIVVYTQSNNLYIFSSFKRRTYKNPLMEKFECISVSGGTFITKKEDIQKQVSKPLRVLVFTVARNIYIWYEDCQQFVRCVFAQSRNLEIEKIAWCNNHALVLLLGNLYHGTITHKLNAQAVTQISEYTDTYTKKEMSTTNKTRIELKRIKNLTNVVDFTCDDKGESFAALVENSRRYFNVTELVKSNGDFGTLLADAHEMDGVHDLLFVVERQTFPAHRFIVCHRCKHLRKLVEKQPEQKEFHLLGYDGMTGQIFELVLRYIYTNKLISRGDIEKLVKRLQSGTIIDDESLKEMTARLRKIFKQLEISALNESLKNLTDDPLIEDYPTLPRDSYPNLRDVTIKLQDNQEIKAHKCVLMARLEYFNMMFSHTWNESKTVHLITIPLEYMDPIVDFLYDNNYERVRQQQYSDNYLFSMVIICDQFFIEELKNIFEVIISDRINLKNVGELIEFAFQYNCEVLKDACMQFISVNLARILELRSLDCLEQPVLAHIDKFYKEFHKMADYRTITPAADAIGDDEMSLFVDNFSVDLNFKASEINVPKIKTPKGKLTLKSSKIQLEKRNYEKEAMEYIRELSFEDLPASKTEENKIQYYKNGDDNMVQREGKNWQKVTDKKDQKKKVVLAASKVNEIMKNEHKVQENFSNLRSLLEKTPEKEIVLSSSSTSDGFGSSRTSTFSLNDIAIQKTNLSQKQRKRLSSTSQSVDGKVQVPPPEVSTPENPWKNVNNTATALKSDPIQITPPGVNRKKGLEPASPLGTPISHTMVSSPPAARPSTSYAASKAGNSSQNGFSKILEDERKQKQYYEKIKSKSLVHTQIEERAIEELKCFYNVDSVSDENITVERYRPQSENSINFAVWQYQ
ncbi:inhibitor of Bruton tyrosine kinase [Toxorhynchites rutilus septentrionalis]|uniref:inhibitor of Bruton tyrosine kinase n=1 Tax=Toxorhynchites rutilus septentrionalis TaxID=329112 RepID=UPI0024799C53|nr:inhibitor of Bruton tyrosine kinase [Toxorhynchites rutilus septentrionalis]